MSVRTVHDQSQNIGCMFDSTTGTAFGPLFERDDVPTLDVPDQIESFLAWLAPDDPRTMTRMRLFGEHTTWKAQTREGSSDDDNA